MEGYLEEGLHGMIIHEVGIFSDAPAWPHLLLRLFCSMPPSLCKRFSDGPCRRDCVLLNSFDIILRMEDGSVLEWSQEQNHVTRGRATL